MLASIKGVLLEKGKDWVIVDVNGFGLQVYTPDRNGPYKIGDDIFLHTHLAITKKGVELYGFKDREGRELFKMIIKVPNVGPKTAFLLLSGLGINGIKKALSNDDPDLIARVKGMGAKTAKRIILELKGKLMLTPKEGSEEVRKALMQLGFSAEEAERSIQKVLKELPELTSNEIVERILRGV
ncbi:Holliday junction branch migration protein RuvA [candidate division WOR-3 bacterium]|nr:Holliday junction branch migration protein RuvA [candidate division WOR-3 bacterium]MCK4526671.1 Holliday junction branch migration protein RuvA [candidate division WOR-3 bacterium]